MYSSSWIGVRNITKYMQSYNREILQSSNNYDAMYASAIFKHNVRKNFVGYNEFEEFISFTLC